MLNWTNKLIRNLTQSDQNFIVNNPLEVQYSHRLIDDLKAQHLSMSQLYDQITDYIEKQKFQQLPQLLAKLYTEFQLHTIQENMQFYRYLEQRFSHNAVRLENLKEQRKEMHQISRRFSHFIRKWQSNEIDENSINEFHQEFVEIRYILVQRVEEEERSFYFMYDEIE